MENKDEKLEKLVDNFMEFNTLETPSIDFTTNVMSQIDGSVHSHTTAYKPLISKVVWWVIGIGLCSLIAYVYMQDAHTNSSLLERLGLSLPKTRSLQGLNLFDGLAISLNNTSMYAFVFLAMMLFVQVPIIKRYLDKHWQF